MRRSQGGSYGGAETERRHDCGSQKISYGRGSMATGRIVHKALGFILTFGGMLEKSGSAIAFRRWMLKF